MQTPFDHDSTRALEAAGSTSTCSSAATCAPDKLRADRRPDRAARARDPGRFSPATVAVRGAPSSDPDHAVVPPLVQSTTFAQPAIGAEVAHTYSRASNPTVAALERALAAIEGAAHARAFASGMAAITALALATLRAGDRVVCGQGVYGGTDRLLRRVLQPFGVDVEFVDLTAPENLDAALARAPAPLVLIESPANPTLELTDIAACAEIARRRGARLAVDNTFLTAAAQRPLELGAHVVVYSTTKYVEGHNLTVGGALVTDDAALDERVAWVRKSIGSIQAPFDAWLTLRGLKTLPLRLAAHSTHAERVARWLEAHPDVERVSWPLLESSPQVALARRQQALGGGVVSFTLRGGAARARAFLDRLQLCIRAENLGATETLVTHPATMTHGDVPPDERARRGVTDGLVRLSVGLEDPTDLVADLVGALGG